MFLLSSFKHDIDQLVPAVSLARDLQVGYFLLAGGAVSAFLGGLVGISIPRKVKLVTRSEPAMVPMSHREPVVVPAPGTAAPSPVAGAAGNGSGAAPRNSRTPAGVGSGR